MKIAIFHELQNGGAKRCVDEYLKYLSKNNTTELFYVDRKEGQYEIPNLKTHFFKFVPLLYSGHDFATRFKKDTLELLQLYMLHKKIAREINKGNYDIVFVHPSQYTQAPFLLRFIKSKKVYFCQEPLRIIYDPEVSTLQNIPALKKPYEKLVRRMRKLIDRKNIEHSDYILSNSRYSQNLIFKAYGKKSTVCYLGVDQDKFHNKKIKKENDFLFIGEENTRSGYTFLLDILKNNKDVRGKIISRGKVRITEEQLVEEYNKSQLVLALSRNEPFGLIPLEAMACEVPIIAIDQGGFRESLVDGVNGYLVKENVGEFSKKVKYLLNNPKISEAMGKKGRELIMKKWTWERSAENLEKQLKIFLQN